MDFDSAKCVCGAVYQAPQTDILEMIGDSALAQSFSGGESGTPHTAIYTTKDKVFDSVTVSGDYPAGSSATYSQTYGTTVGQMTKNNSITLTLNGYAGKKIKSISMSMHSNNSSGTGKFSLVAGSTTIAAINSNTGFNQPAWNGAWSSSFVTITPVMTNANYTIGASEDVVLTITASTNSLFFQSLSVTWE